MIFNGFSAGSAGETTAVIILDRVTQWVDCFPCLTKDTDDTREALQQFVGQTPAKCVYSDNSQEMRKAVAQLGLLHSCATPYRPEANGVVERAVRSVLDGTRSVLLHAGLPHWYWPYACDFVL